MYLQIRTGIFMQSSYIHNGYTETIRKGLNAIHGFRGGLSTGSGSREERLARLKTELETVDAVVIGAGAGLSTSAGFVYSGERFRYSKNIWDAERMDQPSMPKVSGTRAGRIHKEQVPDPS